MVKTENVSSQLHKTRKTLSLIYLIIKSVDLLGAQVVSMTE